MSGGIGWLMDLWQRMTDRHTDVPSAMPPVHLERDPDLDAVHLQQHDLMNRVSYDYLKRSMEERQARLEMLDIQSTPRGESSGC